MLLMLLYAVISASLLTIVAISFVNSIDFDKLRNNKKDNKKEE